MKTKKLYTAPRITSEEISIGVFGSYGNCSGKPGFDWGNDWWFGGWLDFFFRRKRRH